MYCSFCAPALALFAARKGPHVLERGKIASAHNPWLLTVAA